MQELFQGPLSLNEREAGSVFGGEPEINAVVKLGRTLYVTIATTFRSWFKISTRLKGL
jgi:hypothetical protein